MDDWKTEAERLFFIEHKKIVTIALEIGISRQSVSNYLKGVPGYDDEIQRRQAENASMRKYKKMIWMRDSRTEAACIRREHEMAVRELSAEKYH